MKKRFVGILVVAVMLSMFGAAQGQGKGKGHGKGTGNDSAGQDGGQYVFSSSDRDMIANCLTSGTEGLPPGLAKRDRLPPGLERQLQKNGTLPPGLQKKLQPLPRSCEVRLPRLPSNITRVVLGNYVILKDIHDRILDLFEYNRR